MTYKAGIIGAGGIAGMGILGMHDEERIGEERIQASHAGGYEATDRIDLVAIADVDQEKRDKFGTAWGIPSSHRYDSHESMLDTERLDIVSVCTPSLMHADHTIDAAHSPANPDVIWCEKPIASQVSDAEEMIRACDDTDTELVVNHSFRFTEKQQQLCELIQNENLLGNVQSVTAQFRMELMRNSTHLIDTLVQLLDSQARKVSGYITGENEAVDSLNADRRVDDAGGGGFVVTEDETFVTLDCTIPRDSSSMTYQFIGSEGKLYLNNDDGEWRYWRLEDGEHIEEPLPGIEGAWTWENDYTESFGNAAAHIADLLDGDAENRSCGRDAVRSLEIIVAFYVSNDTDAHVSLPLSQPLQDVEITSW
ncbi:gfo/Idh/MocA family oxidoreductase [halophilic archaeon]|nr:gfo/Idh/MocA family oxidoreductase [halophilic archaeon]